MNNEISRKDTRGHLSGNFSRTRSQWLNSYIQKVKALWWLLLNVVTLPSSKVTPVCAPTSSRWKCHHWELANVEFSLRARLSHCEKAFSVKHSRDVYWAPPWPGPCVGTQGPASLLTELVTMATERPSQRSSLWINRKSPHIQLGGGGSRERREIL